MLNAAMMTVFVGCLTILQGASLSASHSFGRYHVTSGSQGHSERFARSVIQPGGNNFIENGEASEDAGAASPSNVPTTHGCYFKQPTASSACGGPWDWQLDEWGRTHRSSWHSAANCLSRKGDRDAYCGTDTTWMFLPNVPTVPTTHGCYFFQRRIWTTTASSSCGGPYEDWHLDEWGKIHLGSWDSEANCLGRKGGHDWHCGTDTTWIFVPKGHYVKTEGFCRGGSVWSDGSLWDCSPGIKTNADCAAVCDATESCRAYDRPAATGAVECCLFMAGSSGNEDPTRECYVDNRLSLQNVGTSGCTQSAKCGECQGDCDSDNECQSGLLCFHRFSVAEAVPGCKSGGGGDVGAYGYCYAPSEEHETACADDSTRRRSGTSCAEFRSQGRCHWSEPFSHCKGTCHIPPPCTAERMDIEFGGEASGTAPTGMNQRPENLKAFKCNSGACVECTDRTGCWHGIHPTWVDGHVSTSIPAGGQFDRHRAELWVRCEHDSGNLMIMALKVENGELKVLVNDETKAIIQSQFQNVSIWLPSIAKDSRVYLDFTRADPTKDAVATAMVRAQGVDVFIDECMDMKLCLSYINVGSASGYALRNSNSLQVQCLEAADSAARQAVSSDCAVWEECLRGTGQKSEVLAILHAAGASSSAALANATDCVDPSQADPESFECECLADLKAKCGGVVDSTCFRCLMCDDSRLCASWKAVHCTSAWKQSNCPASLSEATNVSMESENEAIWAERSRAVSSLDDSLGAKCIDN